MENLFKDMKLSQKLIETLELLGYHTPTDIQARVIPFAIEGKDIIAKSNTGTGKTAAFAIPICEKTVWEENAPSALVLEPTRELTVQVKKEIFNIGRMKKIKVADLFGGFPIDKQILTLKQKTHVAVGTPGRIMDHLRRDTLNISNIKILVIDEADLMLDMGFEEDVTEIIKRIRDNGHDVQIMLFSATLGENVSRIADDFLENAKRVISGEDEQTTLDIDEKLYFVKEDEETNEKYKAFIRIITVENPNKAMIFCGTREMVNVLYQKLKRDRIKCGMLHGEMDQRDRLRTIDEFRDDRFRYLISTDVAARGIDFDNITHVINYDFPTGRETYVHRIGRTGRNGKSGIAVSIVTDGDLKMKKMVEDFVGYELPLIMELPDINDEIQKKFKAKQNEVVKGKISKGSKLNKNITRLSIGGGRKSKMRAGDVVGALCSIDGITMDDVGIIDVRDSLTYVEILNGKGNLAMDNLQNKTIKGKIRKVRKTR